MSIRPGPTQGRSNQRFHHPWNHSPVIFPAGILYLSFISVAFSQPLRSPTVAGQAIARDATTGASFASSVQSTSFFSEVTTPFQPGSAVIWGDYDNDGDLDVLVLGGWDGGVPHPSRIYRNDGGIFTDIGITLPTASAAAWGDYDNDGDLDLVISGPTAPNNGNCQTAVYRNDHGIFVDINAGLPGLQGSVAWGDYDNDGDLDLIICGSATNGTANSFQTILFVNDHGTFINSGILFPGVWAGSLAWGDYDNDGDLDLAILGYGDQGRITKIFRNDRGRFTDIPAPLTLVNSGQLTWVDYDNDGLLDLFVTGVVPGGGGSSSLYRNMGGGNFAAVATPIAQLCISGATWGDFDNDGYPDLVISGSPSWGSAGPMITKVYRNNHGSFEQTPDTLAGVFFSSLACGDYDGDGKLDLLLAGPSQTTSPYGFITKLYRNISAGSNNPPTIPGGLNQSVFGNNATLSWLAASDTETPASGLTYNVRIGTASDGMDIVSPMSVLTTGSRLIPGEGNAGHAGFLNLPVLPRGTYYWSVQTIDNGYRSSGFSPEQSFTVYAVPGPPLFWLGTSSGRPTPVQSISFSHYDDWGFAVGEGGTILSTADRGDSWNLVNVPPGLNANFQRVKVLGFSDAVVLGYDPATLQSFVMSSSDAGSTWTMTLSGIDRTDAQFTFPTATDGFVMGTSEIFHTNNAGASWDTLTAPAAGMTDISFSDLSHGALATRGGSVYLTSNGGSSWYSPPGNSFPAITRIARIDDQNLAVIAGRNLYRSVDGGNSYLLIASAPDSLIDLSYQDSRTGCIISPSTLIREIRGAITIENGRSANMRGVCVSDSTHIILGTFDGMILKSAPPVAAFPAVDLVSPASGDTIAGSNISPASGLVNLAWAPYVFRDLDGYRYRIQFGADSLFTSILGDFPLFRQSPYDDAATLQTPLDTKVYWRMRASSITVDSFFFPWSAVRSFFVPGAPHRSVEEVQKDPVENLSRLDSLQKSGISNGLFADLQASPFTNMACTITAQCIVPSELIPSAVPRMIVFDTSGASSGWHGLLVELAPGFPAGAFLSTRQGDIVTLRGVVRERSGGISISANSMTAFECALLTNEGPRPFQANPIPVRGKTFNVGIPPNGMSWYSRGEQYEGMYVELHHLTVTATAGDGSFTALDDSGGTIITTDESRWYTLRGHRDPQSLYAPPAIGTIIDTLRGFVWTKGNSDHTTFDWMYRIVPMFPGDIVYSPLNDATIRGVVFNDDNRNGIRDSAEQPLPGWRVSLTGQGASQTVSNSNGEFSFAGLDSGTYLLAEPKPQHLPWMLSPTLPETISASLSPHQTLGGIKFGNYYPWCSISGRLFFDINENTVQDSIEPSLPHWRVYLYGQYPDSAWTDSVGRYSFGHVRPGMNVVLVPVSPGWEVIPPYRQTGDSILFDDLNESRSDRTFSLHHVPARIRLKMTVHDNTRFLRQDLVWGARPGASPGIWGADGRASWYDFSEGENEIPPREFAQFLGLFDARFVDPEVGSGYFGYGSWTDMRNFISPIETDQYEIAVLPGYSSGGDYPITLRWSKDLVSAGYSGAVTIDDHHGTVTNMKSVDSIVVTDRSIDHFRLIARQPALSPDLVVRWNLISLPGAPARSRTAELFPTSSSPAFSFSAGGGYRMNDSLHPGIGYWLKYSRGTDSLPSGTPELTADTLPVAPGWNLIGALGKPIDAGTIVSDPPGLLSPNFFKFDGTYVLADSLMPGYGYWVRASQPGRVFLGPGGAAQPKSGRPPVVEEAGRLILTDAEGREQKLLYAESDSPPYGLQYELPPLPPEGIFDARFESQNMLECVRPGASLRAVIRLSSAEFPVTISWEAHGLSMTATLEVDKKKIPLNTNGSVVVGESAAVIALRLEGKPAIPASFRLHQNYPNPFNPSTEIRYELPEDARVTLAVYDILGRLVVKLVDGVEHAGVRSVTWNSRSPGGDLPSGVYFYRIETTALQSPFRHTAAVRKMMILK